MKVLVLGNGGREHAICWKIAQSPLLTKLYCAPGNAGTELVAQNISISATDVDSLLEFVEKEKIDLTVVGPEAPLAVGVVDRFVEKGHRIFGPTREAARMEASKSFSKQVMIAAGVPTAKSQIFSDVTLAKAYVEKQKDNVVIKADGLAAGKGVLVANSKEEALNALDDYMISGCFGEAGSTVLIEECLKGREASVIAIVDKDTIKPFVISQDYKRLGDGDNGPNTGGMGAISPTPVLDDNRGEEMVELIFRPTINELAKRGIVYRGFLYAGIFVTTDNEVKVIEFNCRLGDPETQVLLRRLDSDLLSIVNLAVDDRLQEIELKWKKEAAACIVASSKGYPQQVEDNKLLKVDLPLNQGVEIFQAGTTRKGEDIYTKGGRVLVVSATDDDLSLAIKKAYQDIKKINFEGIHFRNDIGK